MKAHTGVFEKRSEVKCVSPVRNGEPFLRRSKFFSTEPQGLVRTVINLVLYVPNNRKTIPHVSLPRNLGMFAPER